MLMYGPSSCMNIRFAGQGIEYNFTSFKEGGIRLNYLLPNIQQISDDFEFDFVYAQYLMTNDQVFVEFFRDIHEVIIFDIEATYVQ